MKVSPPYPGFFVVLEGIDGAGKSTQAKLLGERLTQHGRRVVLSREPTRGQYGQLWRESARVGRVSIDDEVELFLKDRREHVNELILPRLRESYVVIVDRYYFSTAAYQGARGLDPLELIRRNEEFAPEPDLLVLFDLPVEDGLARVRARGDQADHFEQVEQLRRVREIFLSINKPYLVKVDARKEPGVIAEEIWRAVETRCVAEEKRR